MNIFFNSRPWKVTLVTLSVAAPIFILSTFHEFFLLIVMASVFTMVLKPIVDYLENIGFSRTLAILGLYTVIGSIVVLGFMVVYPVIVAQVTQLSHSFDSEHLSKMLEKLGASISSQVGFFNSEEVTAKLNTILPEIAQRVEELLTSMISVFASFIIVPLIAFFLLNDYYRMQQAFIENVPNKYFEMALNVMYKLERQLSNYIRGVSIESSIVAFIYIIAFYVIGLDYPIILGVIGGLTNIIPLAGPFIGAIPALIVSMVQFGDLRMILPIAVSVVVVQQIDEILIQPNVYGKILNIRPLTIILVILIGSELLGVLGMVLAIPIYTIITVTARETNWGLKNYKITQ